MTFLICSLTFIAGLFIGFTLAIILVMAQDNACELLDARIGGDDE